MADGQPKPEFPPLFPPGLHVLSEGDLFALTVGRFKTSARRPALWQSLMRFCEELRDEGILPCRIWLNGSFLTEKIEPDDIDLILDMDGAVFDKLSPSGSAFVASLRMQPFHAEPRCLHTFAIINFPIGHLDHTFFLGIRKQWEYDFGRALLSKQPKGIAVLEVGP